MESRQRMVPVLVILAFLILLLVLYGAAYQRQTVEATQRTVITSNGLVSAQLYPDWFFQLLMFLVAMTLGGLMYSIGRYIRRGPHLVWHLVDIEIALYVMSAALISLFQFGPYIGVAAGGFCIPGHGGATCYVGYPTSIVLFGIFLLILSVKFPKSAVPVVAFTISFGELLFAPEGAIATVIDPSILAVPSLSPHYTLSPQYFDPGIEAVWLFCAGVMPLLLWRQGHKIRFTIWLPVWFAVLVGFEFFLPYFHTTWWSILVSNTGMAALCFVVWRLFGLNEPIQSRVPVAATSSVSNLHPHGTGG